VFGLFEKVSGGMRGGGRRGVRGVRVLMGGGMEFDVKRDYYY
jgi:hypothetical protein